MSDAVLVTEYDPTWPTVFAELAERLRAKLGDVALRIDHIGSTAVPGLDAKPIIDVQISVASLEPVGAFRPQIEAGGFAWRADNPELTKRSFRERPGMGRTTSMCVVRAASPSSSRCCSGTTYALIPSGAPSMPM